MPDNTFIRQNHRLSVTKSQAAALNQDMGNQRFVWNYFLAKSIARYQLEKKFYFFSESSAMLPALKDEFPFLKIGVAQGLQQTLRQLDVALKGCFKNTKNKKGFPKFKSRSSSGAVCYPQSVKIEGGQLSLPKFNTNIKIKDNGKGLPNEFNSTTITRTASGRYFASFVIPYVLPDKVDITLESTSIGIDLNSSHIFVLSNGQAVVNPKHLLLKEKRLKRYQRQHSRKVKGSKNKEKSRLKLARLHEKVANSRKEFINQVTTQIINSYDVICIEDLNVKGMQKWNGRMIQSAPFGMIRSALEWKAKREGKHLSVIGRYVPSSKACSCCGKINEELSLKTRKFSCDCGNEIHRDLNAAINILNVGLQNITVGTTGLACGETKVHEVSNGIRWVSLKQEIYRSLVGM